MIKKEDASSDKLSLYRVKWEKDFTTKTKNKMINLMVWEICF